MSTQDSTGGSPFSPPQFPKSEYKPPSWPWLPPMPARYPVAVASDIECTTVICNDGSIWSHNNVAAASMWKRLPDIPQPGEKSPE